MANTTQPSLNKQQKEWQAQDDAHALAAAEQIKKDPNRLKAAAGAASTTVDVYGDLNKASDEVVQQAKARMDVDFNAKRLKPGDDGYQWNKEVDFEPPTAVSEWDDDDDE